MTRLSRWMKRKGWGDERVAAEIQIDRSQVNRLRRGVCGASKETALKLQELTGIRWHHFIEKASSPIKRAAA